MSKCVDGLCDTLYYYCMNTIIVITCELTKCFNIYVIFRFVLNVRIFDTLITKLETKHKLRKMPTEQATQSSTAPHYQAALYKNVSTGN